MASQKKKGNGTNGLEKSLFMAIKMGDKQKISEYVECLGCLDCKDKHGDTPLMVAARIGQEEIVQFLLDKGADPYMTNNEGVQAIDIAGQHNHFTVRRLLQKEMSVRVWFPPDLPSNYFLGAP